MSANSCALFCGSIILPNDQLGESTGAEAAEKVFRTASSALPQRLRRLPDGEVGRFFALWQLTVFLKTPWACSEFALGVAGAMGIVSPPSEIPPVGKPEDIVLGETDYDTHAIESYNTFKRLKQEGVIDRQTRFQVCIPTPANIIAICVRDEFKKHVEPLYEALTIKALKNIQEHIPHEELAIQWDCPMEILWLDGLQAPFGAYFDVTMKAMVDRLARMSEPIHEDVELGFHLCYGDLHHRHFLEPKDAATMVNLTNHISSAIQRPINWVHMPVPINRKDEAFFKPLTALQMHRETELYLGLVHANDLRGTRERIAVAKNVVPGLTFGVATECGLGRTPNSDVASIFEILKEVSTPVLAMTPFTALATSMKEKPAVQEVCVGSYETSWII